MFSPFQSLGIVMPDGGVLSVHLLCASFLDTATVRFPSPHENRFESNAEGDGVIVAVGGLSKGTSAP